MSDPAQSALTTHFFPRDEYFMRLALREAEHDDVPIGAEVVREG
jgi:tRNA(adenine34) deaminase